MKCEVCNMEFKATTRLMEHYNNYGHEIMHNNPKRKYVIGARKYTIGIWRKGKCKRNGEIR